MLNEMNQNQNRQAVRYLFPDRTPLPKERNKTPQNSKTNNASKIQFTKQYYSRIIQARNRYDTCVLNYFQFIYLTINVN